MRKTFIGILVGTAMALGSVPSAEASTFLSIDVSSTTLTCNNSTAAGVIACGVAGFVTTINSNNILFIGVINGVDFSTALVHGNQPGATTAQSSEGSISMTNGSGASRTVTIGYASNDFSSPAGSPVLFNATQTGDAIASSAATSVTFTGWGDGGNGLVVGVGSASVAPPCLTNPSPPTNTCSTDGPQNSFIRSGNFGLNGRQIFTLVNGESYSVTSSVIANTVPEPGSMLLLGSGLLGLATVIRRRARKA